MGFKTENEEHQNDNPNPDNQTDENNILNDIIPDDLLKFGLIPEFIGRLPVTPVLDPLTEEQLVQILHEPKNSVIKQYQKLLAMDGVELEVTEEAMNLIAKQALSLNTGARALKSIFESLMLDIMYEAPDNKLSSKIVIDEKFVKNFNNSKKTKNSQKKSRNAA